jgi:hypothetical protein
MERPSCEKNFMSQYASKNSDALRHLTSKQFFEVWNNYDQDGEWWPTTTSEPRVAASTLIGRPGFAGRASRQQPTN